MHISHQLIFKRDLIPKLPPFKWYKDVGEMLTLKQPRNKSHLSPTEIHHYSHYLEGAEDIPLRNQYSSIRGLKKTLELSLSIVDRPDLQTSPTIEHEHIESSDSTPMLSNFSPNKLTPPEDQCGIRHIENPSTLKISTDAIDIAFNSEKSFEKSHQRKRMLSTKLKTKRCIIL